jgi:preprotein translocase SecE subunit
MTMIERLKTYFRETVQEMKRVSWPTLKDLRESTTVVIITVTIITFLVFVVDRVLLWTQRILITRT